MSSSSKTGSKPKTSAKTKKSTTTKAASAKTKKSTTTKRKKISATVSTTKKVKAGKSKTVAKSVKEKPKDTPVQNAVNAKVEKTLATIERLGNQIFALSPFSQYYDDWLINLRQTVKEFEADSNIKSDKNFTKQLEQTLLDMQATFTKLCAQESAIAKDEKILLKVRQDIKELEADYTKKKHELNNKHNADTEQLTIKIKTLENDIETQSKVKISFFQFSTKKAAAQKLEQTKKNLKETRTQLETASQNFAAEQSKLQDNYTTKKQELSTKADTLQKETEQLEIDTSKEARKETCTRLNNIITEQIKRQNTKPNK
jgi:DNA repair exonuclease SbcCD ATPase subunit